MKLPYLRIMDIQLCINIILQENEALITTYQLQPFIDYFLRVWVREDFMENWNIFVVDDPDTDITELLHTIHTTNNNVEGWHRDMRTRLLKNNSKLSFFKFLEEIGKQIIITRTEVSQLLQPSGPSHLSHQGHKSQFIINNRAALRNLYIGNYFDANPINNSLEYIKRLVRE
jgi:hypothetical protein